MKLNENILIIADIHMYKNFYSLKYNTYRDDTKDITYYWNLYIFKYLNECLDNFIKKCTKDNIIGDIIFLGDILDNAYIKVYELDLLIAFIDKALDNKQIHNIFINIANHDCTSTLLNKNKRIKRTALRYLQCYSENVHLIPLYKIIGIKDSKKSSKVSDEWMTIFLPYYLRAQIPGVLYAIRTKLKELGIHKVYLFSHNNIYLVDCFINSQMYSYDEIKKMLDVQELMIFNGHLHPVNYTPKYFQPGSVACTSFKANPLSSGVCSYNLRTHEYYIYNNRYCVLLSVNNYYYIQELINILRSGRKAGSIVFLYYPYELTDDIEPVIKEFSDIIIGIKCNVPK